MREAGGREWKKGTGDVISAPGGGQGGSALVVVDLQNDYVHPHGRFFELGLNGLSSRADYSALVTATNRAIEQFRLKDMPVIHVVTEIDPSYLDSALAPFWSSLGFSREGGLMVAGSWSAGVPEDFAFEDTDIRVVKKGHSAFQHTNLDRLLRGLSVGHVFYAGGAVGGCLADTTTHGAALGYRQFLVTDASYPPAAVRGLVPEGQVEPVDGSALEYQLDATVAPARSRLAVLVVDDEPHILGPDGVAVTQRIVAAEEATRIRTSIAEVVGVALEHNVPVIDISTRVRQDLADSGFPATSAGAIAAKPFALDVRHPAREGTISITKTGPGAFLSPLDRLLRNLAVREVLVAGGDSSLGGAINDTVRDGCGLGYQMTVITDTTYPISRGGLHGAERRCSLTTTASALEMIRQHVGSQEGA